MQQIATTPEGAEASVWLKSAANQSATNSPTDTAERSAT